MRELADIEIKLTPAGSAIDKCPPIIGPVWRIVTATEI